MLKKIFIISLILLTFSWQVKAETYAYPILKVSDFQGKIFDIENYSNQVVMVVFWAQWCGYCRKEMLELDQIYKLYKDKGLAIIALSIDQPKNYKKAIKFAEKFSYPSAFFNEAKTNFSNRKNTVPFIQIIDRKRTKIYSITGYVDSNEIIKTLQGVLF
jgi:thiol-disulfide isomerase/thioredoxin